MKLDRTVGLLRDRFSVLDLGAAGSADLQFGPLMQAVTLLEVDAMTPSRTTESAYYKRIIVPGFVSDRSGHRTFFARKYVACSSFLEPDEEAIRAYGLGEHFELADAIDVECHTLPALLTAAGVEHVDFMKTDLEGLDFAVLSSAPEVVGRALVLQSELHFQPLHQGTPPFQVAMEYLSGLGFELIALRPEVWRYDTPQRDLSDSGRVVWADAIFFLRRERLESATGGDVALAIVKQVVLARALGLFNVSEYLLEASRAVIPTDVWAELESFIYPRRWARRTATQVARALGALPGAGPVFKRAQVAFLGMEKASSMVVRHSPSWKWYRHLGRP